MTSIAVTGATGRLGGRVAARLAAAGIPQTLVVRTAARAPDLPGAAVAEAGYSDPAALRAALNGADVALMVSAAEAPNRLDDHRGFVDAAVAAGVRHVVYTSFFGAAPDCTFTLGRDHWVTEQYIRDSGLAFTFLRDNLYADFLPLMVGADGVLRGPGGAGRVSAVAQDDIADAAAAVLTSAEDHAGATYDLTGPAAISLAEAAEIIGRGTGRAVTYHDETVEEAYASRAGYAVPDWQLDAWVSTYTAIAAGEMAGVSDAILTLTGHRATTLADLLTR